MLIRIPPVRERLHPVDETQSFWAGIKGGEDDEDDYDEDDYDEDDEDDEDEDAAEWEDE